MSLAASPNSFRPLASLLEESPYTSLSFAGLLLSHARIHQDIFVFSAYEKAVQPQTYPVPPVGLNLLFPQYFRDLAENGPTVVLYDSIAEKVDR